MISKITKGDNNKNDVFDKEKCVQKSFFFLKKNEKNTGKSVEEYLLSSTLTKPFVAAVKTRKLNSVKETMKFNVYDDVSDFLKYLKNIQTEVMSVFEVILGHEMRRVYFDLDISDKNMDLHQDILSNLIECLIKVLHDLFNYLLRKEHILLASSHGTKKKSYHLVLPKVVMKNSAEMQNVFLKTTDLMKPEYKKYVDPSVYSKTQQFRVMWSTKLGEPLPRRKIPVEEWYYYGEKIVYDKRDIECQYDWYCDSLLHPIRGDYTIMPLKCREELKEVFKPANDEWIDIALEQIKLRGIEGYNLDPCTFSSSSPNSIILQRNGVVDCKICGRDEKVIHTGTCGAVVFVKSNGAILMNCLRNVSTLSGGRKPFLELRKGEKDPYIYRQVEEEILTNCHSRINTDKIEIPDNHDVIAIKSGCGTGKSEAMLRKVRKMPRDVSILIIVFRKTLGTKTMDEYEGLGFEYYENNELDEKHRLVVQIDSLWKVTKKGGYDLVIMDECEGTWKQLVGSVERVYCVFGMLKNYLKSAKQIILLDAALSPSTVKSLERLGKKVHVVINDFKRHDGVKVLVVDDEQGKFIEMIIENLGPDGKMRKLFIVTNILDFANTLRDHLNVIYNSNGQKIKIGVYSSETHKNGENMVEKWEHDDIVILTPVGVCGISFTKRHFHKTFGFFSPNSADHNQCYQMLFRARQLIDNEIVVNIKKVYKDVLWGNQLSDTQKGFRKMFGQINKERYPIPYVKCSPDIQRDLRYIFHIEMEGLPEDDFVFQIVTLILHRNKVSNVNFVGGLCSLMESQGCVIEYEGQEAVKSKNQKKIEKEMKDLVKENKRMRFQKVVDAPNLTSEQISNLDLSELDQNDRNALQKNKFKKIYGVEDDVITPDLLIKYDNEDSYQQYKNISIYLPLIGLMGDLYNTKLNEIYTPLKAKKLDVIQMARERCGILKHEHCLNFLSVLGFDHPFDTKFSIPHRGALLNYLNNNRKDIIATFGTPIYCQKEKYVIRCVNKMLIEFLGIYIAHEKHKNLYYISSKWKLITLDKQNIKIGDTVIKKNCHKLSLVEKSPKEKQK